MAAPTTLIGIVKQVLSGDTIVIRDRPRDGPPPERIVVLSNINCGRVARPPTMNNPNAVAEDPWAWQAREYVRSKLIGKEVCYVVENELPSGRKYGNVFIGRSITGENIALSAVEEGLAVVRRINNRALAEKNNYYQQLLIAEETAKSQCKGRWSTIPSEIITREIVWSIDDPRSFVENHQGKPLQAIVEHVRDGSTFHLTLLPDVESDSPIFFSVWAVMSGIKAPSFKLEDGEQVPEPFAADAQFFVESRLLHREVTFYVESCMNQNLMGSVLHPNGNIGELLLREGLARCVDWTLRLVSPQAGGSEAYRAAERSAKEKRLRLWKDYQPPQLSPSSAAQLNGTDLRGVHMGMTFVGTVTEVGNGDNITVRCPDGVARKFFFSSIRAPRPLNAVAPIREAEEVTQQRGRIRPLYDIPHMFEAREFLRKFIGKSVSVRVEYIQPKTAMTMDDRVCAFIECCDVNVAEALVSRGLGTVVRYRAATDARAAGYTALLEAEESAQTKGVGVHNKGEAPLLRVADLSGNLAKSRQFLPFMQRLTKVDAIVEFIVNASRLRVFVPRESCLFTFLISGIQCPRRGRILPDGQEETAEPFGEEAYVQVKELCFQRDVQIEVETMDRAGNFIGWLFVHTGTSVASNESSKSNLKKKKKQAAVDTTSSVANLSVLLVSRGLATVNRAPVIERSPYFHDLMRAEETARANKLNIWSSEEFVSKFDAELAASNAPCATNGPDTLVVGSKDAGVDYLDDLSALDLNPIGTQSGVGGATVEHSITPESLPKVVWQPGQVTAVPPTTQTTESLRFFIQYAADSDSITQISRELNSRTLNAANYQPQKGEHCAARFTVDNCWYRARVVRKTPAMIVVHFVDFGNEERIDSVDFATHLAPLPTKAISSIPPQATEYRLAFIQLPPDMEDRAFAEQAFTTQVENKEIRLAKLTDAFPCGKESLKPVPGVTVSLFDPNVEASGNSSGADPTEIDVGELLLSEGLVCVEPMPNHVRRRLPRDMLQRYLDAQNKAKAARKNIWRYGDFRVDSEPT